MRKRILSLALIFSILATLITALPITASAVTSGTCGDNLTWALDDEGTLTISGTGDMELYQLYGGEAPWESLSGNIKNVNISAGVTSIGYCAFDFYFNLESVKISDSVTKIERYAFYNCSRLTSVTIPDSVTSIEEAAFYGCGRLTSVTIGNGVANIGDDVFGSCVELTDIIVAENNTAYCSIDGNLFNKDKTELIQYAIGKKSSIYVIPDSVTSICGGAFIKCNLTSIEIPDSVTSIGNTAFGYCNSLTSITIPDSVTSMGVWVFFDCSGLTNVTIGNSVTSIGCEAFMDCSSLTNVTIGNSVTNIGDSAFYGCKNLTSITIPDSVTSIENQAFLGCESLTSITIPDGVKAIRPWTFEGCSSLTSITIPDSVTYIGTDAFYDCTGLTDVYYSGSEEDWDSISIDSADEYRLTNAKIHYNYSNLSVDKNKGSNSTSSDAPVIKSVDLEYNNTCYDIVNQKVIININSAQKADLIADIDWNGATKPKVYITQGGQVKGGNGISLDFNNENGIFEDIILTSKLKPDMPVYILAMDELTGHSTSVVTKLNIVDLSEDDIYQEVMQQDGVNLKLGKDMEFAIPDDVPVVGGLKLTWKINPFPITVAYESNDKMAITLGLDIDTLEKDGLKKFDGFQFKDFKTIVDDYSKSLDKYGDDILKAYKKQNRTLKQLRNDFRMSEANKTKNKGLTMSAWGGKILKSTGKGDSDAGIEAIGYAEVNKENGKWNWNGASGYIMFQVKVEYTYNGRHLYG